MKIANVVLILFLLLAFESHVSGAQEHRWGFIGNGFHMHFFIEFDIVNTNLTYRFDLPNSFFIDTAEAEQLYMVKENCDVNSNEIHSCGDISTHYFPVSLTTSYLCDIEAPVFKVPNTNSVVIHLERKSSVQSVSGLGTLVFPIHARYEQLKVNEEFDWISFVTEENSYVNRCMNTIFASTGLPLESVESNKAMHCRDIPVGRLSDLPIVYRSLMTLLVTGAVIVILSLSL